MTNIDKASERAYQRLKYCIVQDQKMEQPLPTTDFSLASYFSSEIQEEPDTWVPQFRREADFEQDPVAGIGNPHAAHTTVDVFMPQYQSPSTYDTIPNDFCAHANNGMFDLDPTNSFLGPPMWHPNELEHANDLNMEWDSSELLD